MNADDRFMQPPVSNAHDTEPVAPWSNHAETGDTIGTAHREVSGEQETAYDPNAATAISSRAEVAHLHGEQPEPPRSANGAAATSSATANDMQTDETAGFAGAVQATVTAFLTRLDRIEQRLAAMDDSRGTTHATLTETLTSLEKQISRAGREQFKASTLAEAQRDQLREVLEELHQTATEREARVAELRESAEIAARQERLAMARSILPAIDGLDEALRSGQRLAAPVQIPAPPRLWWIGRTSRNTAETGLRADMQAWLTGLAFVRERLLDVLAAQGIQVIPAQGEQFDPELHLALEVSKAGTETPPGTISAVIRQGYRHEQGILRPAEVVVARADDAGPGHASSA